MGGAIVHIELEHGFDHGLIIIDCVAINHSEYFLLSFWPIFAPLDISLKNILLYFF